MADIIPAARRPAHNDRPEHDARAEGACKSAAPDDPYWYIEALFFAYRGFTGDPDRILNEIGFGRAHHRVLHFVHRYPGMRVADLLEILQITKQSLARVLRELIRESYVAQRSGKADRRERLLYVTDRGGALADRLAAPQLLKIGETLGPLGAEGRASVAHFLVSMMAGTGRLPTMKQSMPSRRRMLAEAIGKKPVPAKAGMEAGFPEKAGGNKRTRGHDRLCQESDHGRVRGE